MDLLLLVRNASHWTTAPQSDDDGWASPITPSVHQFQLTVDAAARGRCGMCVKTTPSKKKTAAVPVPLEAGTSARPTEVQVPGARPRERASMVGQKHT
jgi:hypothetical protein